MKMSLISRARGPASRAFQRLPRSVDRIFRDISEEIARIPSLFKQNIPMPFNRAMHDLESLMENAGMMSMDIVEKEKELQLIVDVPGLGKEDIKISVSPHGMLTISGERKEESVEENDDIWTSERVYGKLERKIQLPENVQADQIKAIHKHGVLRINIPKTETDSSATSKSVQIEE